MDLNAHLGHGVVLLGELGEGPGLLDGMGQGLFAVDIEAGAKRFGGRGSVAVVGGANDDGVEPSGVDHLPVVGEALGLGEGLGCAGKALVVDIADPSDDLAADRVKVSPTSPTDTDDPYAELLAFFLGGAGGDGFWFACLASTHPLAGNGAAQEETSSEHSSTSQEVSAGFSVPGVLGRTLV